MSAIKPGDLVVIVRTHCAKADAIFLGMLATVRDATNGGHLTCGQCRTSFATGIAVFLDAPKAHGFLPVSWVRKIEPLDDAEESSTDTTKPTEMAT